MRRLSLALALAACLLAAGCAGGDDEPGPVLEERAAPGPRLELPYDVEIDGQGRIYVADGLLHQVLRHDPATEETVVVAGTGRAGTSGDGGPATAAEIEEPVGLALDAAGNLFIADFPANRVRRVDADGVITTVAGTGVEGWSGDGGPAAEADLGLPAEVAVDPSGRYVAVPTLGNYIRRIDLESGLIETIAGDGRPRTTGEGGPAAQASVESPHGVGYDESGNLVFPDGQRRIRQVDVGSGAITTVVRGADASAAKVLVTPDDTLYLVDGDPGGGLIRRIAPDGTVEIVVGTGVLGENGEGLPAVEIEILPSDVALAPDGALIFSQTQPEPAVRRVDPATGLVTTLLR